MVKKGKNKQFNGYYLPAVHTNETISGGEQCVLDAYIWVSLGGGGGVDGHYLPAAGTNETISYVNDAAYMTKLL